MTDVVLVDGYWWNIVSYLSETGPQHFPFSLGESEGRRNMNKRYLGLFSSGACLVMCESRLRPCCYAWTLKLPGRIPRPQPTIKRRVTLAWNEIPTTRIGAHVTNVTNFFFKFKIPAVLAVISPYVHGHYFFSSIKSKEKEKNFRCWTLFS